MLGGFRCQFSGSASYNGARVIVISWQEAIAIAIVVLRRKVTPALLPEDKTSSWRYGWPSI